MLSQTNINLFLTWRQRRTPFRLAAFPIAGRRHTSYFSPPNGSVHGTQGMITKAILFSWLFSHQTVWKGTDQAKFTSMKSLIFSRSTLLQKHELKTVSLTEKQMQETEEVLGENIALVSIPGHHWGLECLSWTWRWTWGIGKGWDIGVGSIFWSCCPRAGAEGGSGWSSTWQSTLLLPPHGTCPSRALLGFKVCLLNHWHYILNSSYVTK